MEDELDKEFREFMLYMERPTSPPKKRVSWAPWTIFKKGPDKCHICGHRNIAPSYLDKEPCTICKRKTCIFCFCEDFVCVDCCDCCSCDCEECQQEKAKHEANLARLEEVQSKTEAKNNN